MFEAETFVYQFGTTTPVVIPSAAMDAAGDIGNILVYDTTGPQVVNMPGGKTRLWLGFHFSVSGAVAEFDVFGYAPMAANIAPDGALLTSEDDWEVIDAFTADCGSWQAARGSTLRYLPVPQGVDTQDFQYWIMSLRSISAGNVGCHVRIQHLT